jgi:hypothetical protein
LIFNYQIPVNRFLASETIHGQCTATAYVNSSRTSTYDRPVMYSDDTGKPLTKLSGDEGVIDFSGIAGQPPGWRSAPFSCGAPIEAGTHCWFGLFAQYWQTAYDYGGTLYAEVLGTTYYDLETIPDLYPQDNLASTLYGNMLSMLSELRLSMYFSYTPAQHYTRTLTQGVTLAETLKPVVGYRRGIAHTGTVRDETGHLGDYLRGLFVEAGSMAETKCKGDYYRAVEDTAGSTAFSLRHLFIFIRLLTVGLVRDYLLSRFLRSRDEIVLKSAVTRELELESVIHWGVKKHGQDI